MAAQGGDGLAEVAAVPEHDGGDERVQVAGAVQLALVDAVADLPEPVEEDGLAEIVAGLSLVQAGAGRTGRPAAGLAPTRSPSPSSGLGSPASSVAMPAIWRSPPRPASASDRPGGEGRHRTRASRKLDITPRDAVTASSVVLEQQGTVLSWPSGTRAYADRCSSAGRVPPDGVARR